MSKNSKNARLVKEAKSRNRKNGYKGPAKTTCKHTKARAWYRIGDNNNGKKGDGRSVDKAAKSE